MRANVWTGVCAAIVSVAAVGVFAQEPQTPQTPAAPQAAPSSSNKKITVTGCLRAAPAMATDTVSAANPNPTGTEGTTAAGAPPPVVAGTSGVAAPADWKFLLTSATASPRDTTASAQTYRLIANPTALGEHVGKKLELVGTIDTASPSDPNDPSAAAPALRVESGKIVAANCSE
jgi:hypothetical protein